MPGTATTSFQRPALRKPATTDALSEEGVEQRAQETEHQDGRLHRVSRFCRPASNGRGDGADLRRTRRWPSASADPEVPVGARLRPHLPASRRPSRASAVEGRETGQGTPASPTLQPGAAPKPAKCCRAADIQEILRRREILGVIPESEEVPRASNQGALVIHQKETDAAGAHQDVVGPLPGRTGRLRFVDHDQSQACSSACSRQAISIAAPRLRQTGDQPKTASAVAKERLQPITAREARTAAARANSLPDLQRARLIAVRISKYVTWNRTASASSLEKAGSLRSVRRETPFKGLTQRWRCPYHRPEPA